MVEEIVSIQKFYDSFGAGRVKRINVYKNAKIIFNKTKNCSDVSKRLSIPNKTINSWINEKNQPIGVNSASFLIERGLLPLTLSKEKEFQLFIDIFAFIFGDGHIGNSFQHIVLYGDKKELMELSDKIIGFWGIKTKLRKQMSGGSTKKIDISGGLRINQINGVCWQLMINSSALARLFYLAGAPKGNKVSQRIVVPQWILYSDSEVKRRFLGVLFGNESHAPNLRAKSAFSSVCLGFHKVDNFYLEIKFFMEQLKTMLGEFGIRTSGINFEKIKTLRKDGSKSQKCYFRIDSEASNILRLYKEIPFLYAGKKQKRFDVCVEKFLDKTVKFEKNWEIYDKVQLLHSGGLGRRKIFKKLKLSQNYFYKINSWVHYGAKPKHYGSKELIYELKAAKGMM